MSRSFACHAFVSLRLGFVCSKVRSWKICCLFAQMESKPGESSNHGQSEAVVGEQLAHVVLQASEAPEAYAAYYFVFYFFFFFFVILAI